MSQTLYRKYRSQRFAELVGQEMAVRVLRNSLQRGRISHAYLMCGPRGTGKTSVARIFAKALNCPNASEGDCCGVCDVCTAIAQGTAVDVVEMDAASNRGIDDVRELAARVQRGPLSFQRKVYIIDEVHMITKEGFNALLKTLEEPPPHVVFCLCTTDPGKLPVTILSRCIRLDFQRIALPALAAHLRYIAAAEGMELTEEAALRLAALGEGSARDAISLLDQLTVYCESLIGLDDVNFLFQLGDPAVARKACDLIEAGSPAGADKLMEELANLGWEYQRFLLEVSAEVQRRYAASGDSRWRKVVETIWAGLNLIREESFPSLLVQLVLAESQAHFGASAPMRGASIPPALPEELSNAAPPQAERSPLSRVAPPSAERGPGVVDSPAAGELHSPSPRSVVAEQPSGLLSTTEWERFWKEVHKLQMTLAPHLLRGVSGRLEGGELVLSFSPDSLANYNTVSQPKNIPFLLAGARRAFGDVSTVRIHWLESALQKDGSGSRLENESSAAVPAALRLAADGLAPAKGNADLEEEIPKGVSGERLERGLERIERQIGDAVPPVETGSSPGVDKEFIIELFQGQELVEEERP